MEWLWIILRYLFPADPIRQGAEAMRHRVKQLIHVSKDQATIAQLLIDPALRLQLELAILDAEDCLRLWIAMRGHQIAKLRPKLPRDRATPHLTHAKSLAELLARIAALVDDCQAMEQRAQAHAAKLTQMRDADPLYGIDPRASRSPLRHASHATSPSFAGGGQSSLAEGGGGGATRSVVTEGAGRNAAGSRHTQGRPYSIAGANP